MNITHNTCDKYIRNQLFSSLDEQENEYESRTRRFEHSQEGYGEENLKREKEMTKNQKPFNERSNFVDLSEMTMDKKESPKESLKKQVKIGESYFEGEKDEKDQTGSLKKESSSKSDVKPKKKFNHRKNNLKQLFLDIEDKVEEDRYKEIEEKLESEKNQKEIDQLSELKENILKFEETENGNSPRIEEISSQEIDNLKVNKFHFLHNDLDFNSSSEEEGEGIKDSARQYDSSENDFDEIAFELPKPRSKKNIFINSSDFDVDSSDEEGSSEKRDEEEDKENEKSNMKESDKDEKLPKSHQNLTVSDFRRDFISHSEEYLKKSLPSNASVDLIVKRDKSKQEYYIYDSKTFKQLIVIAKKSSTYEIYAKTNVENPRAHPDLKYLTAKVETNFLGTEFNLKYIHHEFSNDKTSEKDEVAATISYETNFLGFNGPRKMNVYIPEFSEIKYHEAKSLESLYSKNCRYHIDKYVNKQAKWNNEIQSYVLNLKGKAKLSSVKNFVIVKDTKDQEIENKNFVIFGKTGKDIFNLSISGPFSILQGVGIAISSFERKLTCE